MIQGLALSGFALISLACGIFMLQAAWRSKESRAKEILVGWGLVLAGLVFFSFKNGPEKGIALGLVGMAIFALAFLAWQYIQATPKAAKSTSERIAEVDRVNWTVILRRSLVFVMIAFVAGLAALSLSTGIFSLLNSVGAEHTTNLVTVMILFPLLWAGLAVIIGADKLLWRKSLITLGTGLIPLAYMMVGM
ncbi:hypothetical protein [Hirschia baltica]|uniref:Uncharacterized protein n=1 Tax=Hirschia baltica (strain ATCC 49814 / DSM 5838 / IFAM 1418) TaxID=582402 RepID=C6XLS9_HIRBI|nr:hypothetical protein [Hirschia baltica]ACT57985.1 hypothetical protein Hbal_0283 [Hirschia baltica ATCC 49814]